eukprot:12374-Heterococcus_DN1.PRE.2
MEMAQVQNGIEFLVESNALPFGCIERLVDYAGLFDKSCPYGRRVRQQLCKCCQAAAVLNFLRSATTAAYSAEQALLLLTALCLTSALTR